MSAEEAVELAAAGGLYGLEPFDISPSHARELRAEAERERGNGVVDDPRAARRPSRGRGARLSRKQIARIRAIEEPTAKQLSAMREAMRALEDVKRRQARRVARERLSRPPSKPKPKCRRLTPGSAVQATLASAVPHLTFAGLDPSTPHVLTAVVGGELRRLYATSEAI